MTQMELDDLLGIFRALEQEGVEYVLVGGVAIGLRGIERATNDVDLFIDPSQSNVLALKKALRSVFDDPSIDEISADDLAGDYPTVRYGPPEGDFFVDIIGRLGSTVSFDDLESESMDVAGTRVNVATPRTLYRMKRDTVRPIDKIDAFNLRDKFSLEDE